MGKNSLHSASVRWSACGLALAFAAGCGGGSGTGGETGGGGSNPPTTVTVTLKGNAPAALAAKIGSGAFTAQTLNSSQLSLSIPSGTTIFAVAYVCQAVIDPTLQVTEQTVLELSTLDGTAFTEGCGNTASAVSGMGLSVGARLAGTTVQTAAAGPTGTLTGSVDASAISGAPSVNIYAQNESSFTQYGSLSNPLSTTSSFSFSAPAGNDRVEVIALKSITFSGLFQGLSVLAARDFPNQTVPGALNGGNTVVLGPADQTLPQPITYNNVPSGYSAPSTEVMFQTGVGGFVVASQATSQYPALPPGAVENGDKYVFFSSDYSSSKPTEGVSVEMTAASGGPVAVTFPPPWSNAGPTPAALPGFDFTYSGFPTRTGVFVIAGMGWSSGTVPLNFSLLMASANYQNGSPTVKFPDLSGLSGFLPAPPSGTQVTWLAQITQASGGQVSSPSNVMAVTVSNSGFFNVP